MKPYYKRAPDRSLQREMPYYDCFTLRSRTRARSAAGTGRPAAWKSVALCGTAVQCIMGIQSLLDTSGHSVWTGSP